MQIEEKVSKFNQGFVKLKDEIAKNIVGQSEVVDGVIICL